MKNQKFYFEMTDTYGGDLNYCWLYRFSIEAKTLRGALRKLSKETGFNFRLNGSVYMARRACVAAYLIDYEVTQDWIERAKEL